MNTTFEAFNCHTCGIKGDSWSLIMQQEGVKFPEAKRFATEHLGFEGGDVRRSAKRRKPYKPSWT